MSIDTAEVLRIARLARLDLDAETVERLRHQLGDILDYVAVLGELDVSDMPATVSTADEGAAPRPDEVAASLSVDQALANAPNRAAGQFCVPRVFKE